MLYKEVKLTILNSRLVIPILMAIESHKSVCYETVRRRTLFAI